MVHIIPSSTLERFSTFGDLLRFLRRRAGITQMDLATAVGYSDAQISRLEQNLRLPDIPTIEARFVPALGLEDEKQAVARLLELAANVRREDAPVVGLCPYKGMNFFDEGDTDLFVGREALTTKLADRLLMLASNPAPDNLRFLAVVGASGSGKSSLVRAGVAPALRWNKESSHWDIFVLTPTERPLESLAMTLTQESGSLTAAARLMDDLQSDPRCLHLYARQATRNLNAARLLLVVDQFEELFALCRSEDERAAFIGNLITAASEPDGPVVVLITLRADFYAHCASYAHLRAALALTQAYIGVMTDDELRRAIEEPARRGRWGLEPGLVDLLLHDVGREPGALPLLSHALYETWQRRRGRTLTLSGYTSSGGVRGAIAETAEAVFSDHFNPEQRLIARRIFLRLTELGEETATGDTRRRASFTELILKPEEAGSTQLVLKALADARLIITSENSAEVSHEALIREWPTLRGWLEDNRESLRLHRHLTEAAQEWISLNRAADVLYRGARLVQALEWAGEHLDELNLVEQDFLAASQDLAECEANEREIQRQKELDAAQMLAEAERQRADEQIQSAGQLRKRSIYLAAAFVLAALMALAALLIGRQWLIEGRLATSRELAAAAAGSLDIDPERSLLLALQALEAGDTAEANEALHQALMTSRVRQTITASDTGKAISVTVSPDGKRLAAASQDEQVKVWGIDQGNWLYRIPGHSAAFSRDSQQLATVLSDGSVALWDAISGKPLPLTGHIDAGATADISPDGTRLATITAGNLPRIWEIASGNELAVFPGHSDYISTVSFSPDGQRILTASDDGTARIWDAASGSELIKLADHPGWVWTAVFSPDGSRVATVSEDQTMIWDAITGKKLATLAGHLNSVYVVAWSPDGSRLATGGADRKVLLWDATAGQELSSLAGHTGAVTGLAFLPDGSRLASGSDDGTVRIWDVTSPQEGQALPNSGGVSGQVAFSPDGSSLVGEAGNTIKRWDVSSGNELPSLTGIGEGVTAHAVSPNGRLLAAAGDDLAVRLWDVNTGELLIQWPAHTGRVNAIAFQPGQNLLFTVSDDYKIKSWDVSPVALAVGEEIEPFETIDLQSQIKSLAFSPDGAYLAVGTHNGSLKVLDTTSFKEIFSASEHDDSILDLAFSPVGEKLASAGQDGLVNVWLPQEGVLLRTFSGHTDAITDIAWNPDGIRLTTASRDGTSKEWDPVTGEELLTLFNIGGGHNSVAYSPDGKTLAASTRDGLRLYLLDTEELAALARSRTTRALTVDECQKYLHRVNKLCVKSVGAVELTPLPPVAQSRICQVTDTGGLNDNYFNHLIYQGVEQAAIQHGWLASALESKTTSDFDSNLKALAGSGCQVIVAPGSLVEAVEKAALEHPQQQFMVTDFVLATTLENVWTQVYATDQAAFLAGYAAASVTKTGKVGVFGGVDIPQVTDFMDGFALGVRYFNSKNDAQVELIGWDPDSHSGLFVGGFCCTTEGRELARQLLEQGADIILPVAGESVGWGAGAEIKEHGSAWFIGVDSDWTITSPELAEVVLTSIEKRYDASILTVAQAIIEGRFSGGGYTGTLATNEVGISPFLQMDWLISDQLKADLEQIRLDIISGKIVTKP